jgi:DNA-binding MurR/RpiR family transcriptional regulator
MLEDSFLTERPDLTPAQRRVLRFLMEHEEEAPFLTVTELARRAGVSEATVVRLAQSLGFDGYPDLIKQLRKSFMGRLSTVVRLQHTVEQARPEQPVYVRVMEQDLRNINETLSYISVETFEMAVSDLQEARRVYAVGLRGAHSLALHLVTYLRFLDKEAHLLKPGYGELWDAMEVIGEGDLVFGISFPRYTRLTREVMEDARARGARVGALTDSWLSPLVEVAHWVLTARCKLDSFIESFTAAMSVLNSLLTAMSVASAKRTRASLERHEAVWRKKGVYWESE